MKMPGEAKGGGRGGAKRGQREMPGQRGGQTERPVGQRGRPNGEAMGAKGEAKGRGQRRPNGGQA